MKELFLPRKGGDKMKKLFILLGVILLSIFCVGCDKNEEVVNELSKEELNYLIFDYVRLRCCGMQP